MQLLGGEQREALGKVEAHLVAEHRERADAGPVLLLDALVEDAPEEIEIGLHAAESMAAPARGVSNPKWTPKSGLGLAAAVPARDGKAGAWSSRTARDAADLFAPLFADAERREARRAPSGRATRRLLALDDMTGRRARRDRACRCATIFAAALSHDAAGLVIAHNHPSGDPAAEPGRHRARRGGSPRPRPRSASRLHDHLIFAGGECRSFRELGLL